MNQADCNAIHLCQKKMSIICQGLEILGLKNMAMYVIFNDGSHFELSNVTSDIKPNYQGAQSLINPIHHSPQQDYYLFEKEEDKRDDLVQPIFNIIRSHFEGIFVFRALGIWPEESTQVFYEKTVIKFEDYCIKFMDFFMDVILSSNTEYKFSFVLNNRKLREAVIKQGYAKQIRLSLREQECLWHAGMGKSAKEIAQVLHISPYTVEEYLKKIKTTFDSNKLPEIMIECMHRGIIGKTNYFKSNQSQIS